MTPTLTSSDSTPIITYPVTVPYSSVIEDLVLDGPYDWWHKTITSENFPTTRTGLTDLTIELVHFGRFISTDEALRELDQMGYRPAELHELLAFGEKYPDVHREFPIIALGSVCRSVPGDRRPCCAYLFRYGSEYCLDLFYLGQGWRDDGRFAAVRK